MRFALTILAVPLASVRLAALTKDELEARRHSLPLWATGTMAGMDQGEGRTMLLRLGGPGHHDDRFV